MSLQDQDRTIAKVNAAIERIRSGGMVIMVDDEDRENEGDIVFAAQFATPENINFMAKHARGLICLTLVPEMVERLQLPLMGDPGKPGAKSGTAFTVSIEARHGVTTGISAHDRAHTVQVAIRDDVTPHDLTVPGHIFPLRARNGGVLERAGHTEGSVDLARLAGLKPAAVICEIMNDDGSMARMPDLEIFAAKHDIPIVAIADIITYRLLRESHVREVHTDTVKTVHGIFQTVLFENTVDQTHHIAFIKGTDFAGHVVDVRVHSERQLVDTFGPNTEGGRKRMLDGLEVLKKSERGVFLYLMKDYSREELLAELAELSVTNHRPFEPVPMHWRLHGTGAQILRALGVRRMRVFAGSQRYLVGLSGFGLEIVETVIMDPI